MGEKPLSVQNIIDFLSWPRSKLTLIGIGTLQKVRTGTVPPLKDGRGSKVQVSCSDGASSTALGLSEPGAAEVFSGEMVKEITRISVISNEKRIRKQRGDSPCTPS